MKKLILTLGILLASVTCFAQDYDPELYKEGSVPFVDGKVIFTSVKEIEGASADQLYGKLKMFVADVFKSSSDVTKLDDDANRILIVKGFTSRMKKMGMVTSKYNIWFTLKLQAKDGRYKVDIYDITNVCPATTIGTTRMPESKVYAETLTDANCLKNGVVKKTGYGFQRRVLVDTMKELQESINNYMQKESATQSNDW